jgi:hypothetical protein
MNKSSNEFFLYMSVNFKRKNQWTFRGSGSEEMKHIKVSLHRSTFCRKFKGREINRERDPDRNISIMQTEGDILTGGVTFFQRRKERIDA